MLAHRRFEDTSLTDGTEIPHILPENKRDLQDEANQDDWVLAGNANEIASTLYVWAIEDENFDYANIPAGHKPYTDQQNLALPVTPSPFSAFTKNLRILAESVLTTWMALLNSLESRSPSQQPICWLQTIKMRPPY